MEAIHGTLIGVAIHLAIEVALILRVMLRPHRQPASRIAWVAVIAALPVVGILAYLLFGEVNIGRRRVARMREVIDSLPQPATDERGAPHATPNLPRRYEHLFRLGRSISGFAPVGGNAAELMADSNAAIAAMAADIDAAQQHVHALFYIWLTDDNGLKIAEALKRAAARGVKCRAMADGLGSRAMIRSPHWSDMRQAGVDAAVALPIGNPLLRPLVGRIDLRNHRKILVIDGAVTYCGSQNCADPEFRVKPKYAPWVDAMVRFEGPLARQNLHLFASDWMTYTNEDLRELLREPVSAPRSGFTGQVIGTGPTVRESAMPEMFESLIYAADRELVITTPYFVPNESMQSALRASAYRGVEVTIIFPARNDSRIVAAASRSYYEELLEAGVQIHEYVGGLLHTKSLTVDGEVGLIGSANMDRRSFDLNYENNILFCDKQLTAAVRKRQQEYLASSTRITLEHVAAWSIGRRLWNNTLATLGPIL
ncbi:MAG: cardiolipin synthase [Pirellulaceae bacterium]